MNCSNLVNPQILGLKKKVISKAVCKLKSSSTNYMICDSYIREMFQCCRQYIAVSKPPKYMLMNREMLCALPTTGMFKTIYHM
jgi:hypothetical protein